MPPSAPPKEPVKSEPVSAKALVERMTRLAADIDGQKLVVERACEGETAAAALRKDAELALADMKTKAREATAEWSKLIGAGK